MNAPYTKLVSREGKKGKMTCDYRLKNIYKYYRENTGPAALTKIQFGAFIKEINKEIANTILAKPDMLHLMCQCGGIGIQKYKQNFANKKKLRVDWATSKKLGKRIYHLNEHRDGYKYFFRWEKPRNVTNITAYSFIPTRGLWRELGHILKTNPSMDYPTRVLVKRKKASIIPSHGKPDTQ